MKPWIKKTAAQCSQIFDRHEVTMTLGGEPTFVPPLPDGPEWNYSAVGPTKLVYARTMASTLISRHLGGGVDFFSPGKSYPGEVNPRWAVRIIANKDGSPIFRPRPVGTAKESTLADFRQAIAKGLGVKNQWKKLKDTTDEANIAWAIILDEVDDVWKSYPWPGQPIELTTAPGPAGLRLPLYKLGENIPRRALTLEWKGEGIALFMPPVLQGPFLRLLKEIDNALVQYPIGALEMQGYVPSDDTKSWTQVGLAADPGVLEINLPACKNWEEYDFWLRAVTECAEASGLRSWKTFSHSPDEGTGGGNHLVFGGSSLETNPFFTRPAWMASILRYWQHHPALAYVFTGCYVGASSQAPRPDESARDLHDLEMAYSYLQSLPEGDHRHVISETLRHLQTDVTGNSHRSEISLDKFWNPAWPSGSLGLLEFRAIETFPHVEWMSAVALLWTSLAAMLLDKPMKKRLHRFSTTLHDRYLLPSALWQDLSEVLADLGGVGFSLDEKTYRNIWDWKFPEILHFREKKAEMSIRRAHESWPLLCETPVDGGTTSRFVDTSMQRLEMLVNSEFVKNFKVHINGRPLVFKDFGNDQWIAGLRYRRTNLYPSLHPGLPPQTPLQLDVIGNKTKASFALDNIRYQFSEGSGLGLRPEAKPCKTGRKGDWTFDLRLG